MPQMKYNTSVKSVKSVVAVYAAVALCGVSPGLRSAQQAAAPRVLEVRMTASRFEPGETLARAGDTLRFVNAGGLHNVLFFADSIAAPARQLLVRAMTGDKIGPLASPLLIERGEQYQFVVPALPAGRYPFVCQAHYAMRMVGTLVVQ